MSGILYWIVVGLIAGWLAGRVMKGGGYGVVQIAPPPGVGGPARFPSEVTQLVARSA
jgi:hypothetical protein